MRKTIEQLKLMRETEDHIEFKKASKETFRTMVAPKQILPIDANVFLVMSQHSVTKREVLWLSECTTIIPIKSLEPNKA